jgi:hypothetical protein
VKGTKRSKLAERTIVDALDALACLHTARALQTYDNKVFVSSTMAAKAALDLRNDIKKRGIYDALWD